MFLIENVAADCMREAELIIVGLKRRHRFLGSGYLRT